jgi:hypothetical protein
MSNRRNDSLLRDCLLLEERWATTGLQLATTTGDPKD